MDRLLPLLDLREQVVSFPPQPVITEDNLVVSIDTVVYFQVTDARAATYEIANYIQAVEQLTTTTLRNVVGGLNLEEALTSRDQINGQLRGVLDEATGRWGIRVSRVELKAIDPPHSIQDSMEKQMRAERDRRAAILTAEGTKQSAILTAEGQRQAAILKAEGDAKAAILRADGEAQAIQKVFDAIHKGNPDQKLLAYQYLQTLPKLAEGSSNKLWIIPSEVGEALKGIGSALGGTQFRTAALRRPVRASRRRAARAEPSLASESAESQGGTPPAASLSLASRGPAAAGVPSLRCLPGTRDADPYNGVFVRPVQPPEQSCLAAALPISMHATVSTDGSPPRRLLASHPAGAEHRLREPTRGRNHERSQPAGYAPWRTEHGDRIRRRAGSAPAG